MTITLRATSSVTIAAANVANEAVFTLGATSGVATGTGTNIASYANNVAAGLVIGVSVSNTQATATSIRVPIGWYLAIRQTQGTGVTIASAFEQSESF